MVAPVPWFPSGSKRFGRYARFAAVPKESEWQGTRVLHPRYPVLPGPGWYLGPFSYAVAAYQGLTALTAEGFDFELIDAHYYFPDGVAAAMVGRWLRRPVVISARGTDINLIPQYALARAMVRWAAASSNRTIAVSLALKNALAALGVAPGRVAVLRNGVDLDRFRPLDRDAARAAFGVSGKVILSVGNIIELKGHHLVLEALQELLDWTLMIAGDGPDRAWLERLAGTLGVTGRVHFLGAMRQEDLVWAYNAADVLVLASRREGMPNVVLEALACGTPVVATAVGGVAEVLEAPRVGRLVGMRTPAAIAAALRDLDGDPPARAAVRDYARTLGWDETIERQLELYETVLGSVAHRAR